MTVINKVDGRLQMKDVAVLSSVINEFKEEADLVAFWSVDRFDYREVISELIGAIGTVRDSVDWNRTTIWMTQSMFDMIKDYPNINLAIVSLTTDDSRKLLGKDVYIIKEARGNYFGLVERWF
jgi:hypothetical protein